MNKKCEKRELDKVLRSYILSNFQNEEMMKYEL